MFKTTLMQIVISDVIRYGGDNSTHVKMSVKKKNQQDFWLKSTSVLYWILIEGVFDYAVVSGLVNLDQSGQAHLVVRWGSGVEYHQAVAWPTSCVCTAVRRGMWQLRALEWVTLITQGGAHGEHDFDSTAIWWPVRVSSFSMGWWSCFPGLGINRLWSRGRFYGFWIGHTLGDFVHCPDRTHLG